MLPDFMSSDGKCFDFKTSKNPVLYGTMFDLKSKPKSVYEHHLMIQELADCVIPDPRSRSMMCHINEIDMFKTTDSVVYFDIEASSDSIIERYREYGFELKSDPIIYLDSLPGTPEQELRHFIKGLEL